MEFFIPVAHDNSPNRQQGCFLVMMLCPSDENLSLCCCCSFFFHFLHSCVCLRLNEMMRRCTQWNMNLMKNSLLLPLHAALPHTAFHYHRRQTCRLLLNSHIHTGTANRCVHAFVRALAHTHTDGQSRERWRDNLWYSSSKLKARDQHHCGQADFPRQKYTNATQTRFSSWFRLSARHCPQERVSSEIKK